MFVTSSLDCTVNLWDTNCEEVIRTFNVECGVNSIHLSPCAQSHSLIAAASEDSMIHLCDIRTGKSIWKLTGILILINEFIRA
jgi:WD40 repeat protein